MAPDATSADVWATALSVLGTEGLSHLPEKYEAMLVIGEPGKARAVVTRGLQAMLVEGPSFPIDVVGR